jgi:hypothetical protein
VGELVIIYGLHEKALRQIARRPPADYNEIRALEKAERRTRPRAEIQDGPGT